jgi:ribosomal protein L7/L12
MREKKAAPRFPYNKKTETITLPKDIEDEIHQMVLAGNKVAAVKKVFDLTGAGLRISKEYVDSLI